MQVTLIHAYSTTNSGDGLLVHEAAAVVRSAFPDTAINLLALDPRSFEPWDHGVILHPITGAEPSPPNWRLLSQGALRLLGRSPSPEVRDLLDRSTLVVAVGGGYLRAKNLVEAVKTVAAHGPQLPFDGSKAVYLPQSIGPLRFGTRRFVLRRLRWAKAVHLRDDRSVEQVRGLRTAHRSPDLALLGLPAAWKAARTASPSERIGVVARALPGDRRRRTRYLSSLEELLSLLPPSTELLVQAAARGNDDVAFYRRELHRDEELRPLKDAVRLGAADRPSCVVSVRLHGAIESIRSGVPSVHLSYERKGWGAFEDLRVAPFVHNAFDFDPQGVAAQAISLAGDAGEYWASVSDASADLEAARALLVAQLRSHVGS